MNGAVRRRILGLDVGSTTVKAVLVEADTCEVLFSDYRRHHTRQPETVIDLLEQVEGRLGTGSGGLRIFATGSGSGPIVGPLGAKFVQEVNAVALAAETRHPDVRSVVELGGQDAKIILFKTDPRSGERSVTTSMNDKCASGTGATIDKCMIKVGAEAGYAEQLHFGSERLHHVAAKCGVFAETDIVNLVKTGIPQDEVLCSLADAIVLQNLSVLARGNTLHPRVLLLGGPNAFLPFLRECWQLRIPETWRERGANHATDTGVEQLIFVPDDAALYAALGAAMFGSEEAEEVGVYRGLDALRQFVRNGRRDRLGTHAGPPLAEDRTEIDEFVASYRIPPFEPARFAAGAIVRGVIGLDGGSTSSKAVLLDEAGSVLCKAYQLSKGNPIQDAKDLLRSLRDHVESQGASLDCFGFGATGYAADVLEECLLADVNVVETAAHMMSANHYFGDVDVVCDIGGQDIKVLFLKNGDIQGFKLSNSCSAGNGMLLQAMADQFGVPINEYAEVAFAAELAPKFSYGCAVFLDSDRVNFQKEGFQKQELLAGLAQVLPKNVWQYVAQIPRLAALGKRFVLQGGTQYNLAAVKAQVDYIKQRVPDAEVFVHPHAGEAGAIGAAIETLRRYQRQPQTRFVGVSAALDLAYSTRNDGTTTCHFCANECRRTFIDAQRPDGSSARCISGFSCEKGTVESNEAMLALVAERKQIARQYPNLVEYEGKKAFMSFYRPEALPLAGTPVEDVEVRKGLFRLRRRRIVRPFERSRDAAAQRRQRIRVGIPRVLNLYATAPFFRAYFETLGVLKTNVMFSDPTSEEMWVAGGKYGAVDPCFPSKVVQAHVHDLLFNKHAPDKRRRLDYVFFPIITHVPNFVADTMDDASCPIVAGTPDVIKATFTKEIDFFAQCGIRYLAPALSFAEPTLLARRMFEVFGECLEITEDESDFACRQGWRALQTFDADLQAKGQAILETVEAENRLAILVLDRPYHADPGLNHGIPEQLQVLGYPILSIRSIPRDEGYLRRFFTRELADGKQKSPLELSQIWPENYSANSAQKVWAANFVAHHPHLAVLDLSSFKCGHDAPTYALIDTILQTGHTPASTLHDLDANNPGGSIKIRVKTYAHSLRLHQERLEDLAQRTAEFERAVEHKRQELLALRDAQIAARQRVVVSGVDLPEYSPRPTPARDSGLLPLGRKVDDGRIERLRLPAASEPTAAE